MDPTDSTEAETGQDSAPALDLHTSDPEREAPASRLGLPALLTIAAVAAGAVALLAIFFSGGDSGSTGTAAGSSGLNDFVFTTEDGAEATLADFEGEPLVVNFFASWCAPCRAELPDFEEVHVESEGRVSFVGVNHDIDETAWRSFLDEVDLSYPTVFQPGQEIWDQLNLFGMPATVFITPDGEVVHTFAGVLNQQALKDLIAEHLNVEV